MGAVNGTNSSSSDYDYHTRIVMYFIFGALVQPMSDTYKYIGFFFSGALTILMSGFGVVTNVINILVFYRQGILSDRCTPSLVALVASDACVTCLALAEGVFYCLVDLDTSPFKVLHWMNTYALISNTVAQPYPMLTLYTCYVTAYIAFERMISVTFPFRVGEFFSPKRSAGFHVIMACILFVLNFPHISAFAIGPFIESEAALMRTSTELVTYDVLQLSVYFNLVVLRAVFVAVVIVCNVVVSAKVNLSNQFRKGNKKSSDVSSKDKSLTKKTVNKEMKLIRMMSVLCLMMVVCYIPSVVSKTQNADGYVKSKAYEMVTEFLEIINSSCNIIILYTMSSRYRKELDQMCPCCARKTI